MQFFGFAKIHAPKKPETRRKIRKNEIKKANLHGRHTFENNVRLITLMGTRYPCMMATANQGSILACMLFKFTYCFIACQKSKHALIFKNISVFLH